MKDSANAVSSFVLSLIRAEKMNSHKGIFLFLNAWNADCILPAAQMRILVSGSDFTAISSIDSAIKSG